MYILCVNTRFEADKLQGLGFPASRGERDAEIQMALVCVQLSEGSLESIVALKNQDCVCDTLFKWKFAHVHGPNMLLLHFSCLGKKIFYLEDEYISGMS